MNWDLYLTFMGAALALTIMPGPDNIYVLTESLSRGSRRGVSLSAGLASGVLVHTTLAATGIALLLQEFPQITWTVKGAGTLYLLYLAFGAWREDVATMTLEAGSDKSRGPGFWSSFGKGFLMNVLNPKVTLFFLALLPQFVDAKVPLSSFEQMLFMGISFMIQAFMVFSLIAWLSGSLHHFLASKGFWEFCRWLQIIVLSFLALGLWWL